jgi:hypothetical protein
MLHRYRFVLPILMILMVTIAGAEEIIIQPGPSTGKDTWVGENEPTTNHGNQTYLYFGGWGGFEFRLYIQFDLSSFSSSTNVETAQLDFFMGSQNGEMVYNYSVFRVTEAWSETGLTWNNQPLHAPLEAAFFSGLDWQGGIGLWHSITGLDGLVDFWIDNPSENFGLVIMPTSTFYGHPLIWSSEYGTSSSRPKLVINGGIVANEAATWNEVKQLYR